MADEKDTEKKQEEAGEETAAKSKGGKKGIKFAILGGIILVVGAGMFFLVTEVVAPMLEGDEATASEETIPEEPTEPANSQGSGFAFELGEIITNPAGTAARRYIKVNVTLEFENEANRSELENRSAFVKDVIIRELTSRTVDELTDPVAKDEMREGMVDRLNQLFAADPITGVHFTEYVIQ